MTGIHRFCARLGAWFVVIGLATSVASAQGRAKPKPTNPNSLRRQLGGVRNQKNAVRRELQKTNVQVRETRADLETLDQRLARLSGEVERTRTELDRNRAEQARVERLLAELQEQLAKTKAQVRRRLRAIYMQTNGTYISLLTGAESVGDFASRAGTLRTIATKDRELFERYRALTDRVAERKRAQDRVVSRIEDLRRFQNRKEGELKETKQEKAVALGELRAKQAELTALLRQYEQDERAIAAEIAAYQRRIRAARLRAIRVAKERKRQQELARKRAKQQGKPPPREVRIDIPPEIPDRAPGRFIRPVSAPVTSGFGNRLHPILRVNRLHAGVDFGARTGAPIRAVADGIVVSAGYSRGYGNRVIIDHGGGVATVYAHCSSLSVGTGQSVRQGQRIGAVGSTGLSTGPHLHFEVRINGRPVNPMSRF
ncbi:MAG: peptidoglycan DD-metalloendopeptidase family protein [Fimbriimonadaceae bacterium]|nr:peptidoglycan DD-metalloendopeptidase family protein [Fimbriimonadaceae bacterium]